MYCLNLSKWNGPREAGVFLFHGIVISVTLNNTCMVFNTMPGMM